MKLAYLLNRYPMPSQTFIRREIAALEASGIPVLRISVRPTTGEAVDEGDLAEVGRTRVVLDAGPGRIALAVARRAVRGPGGFARALGLAVRLGRKSQRGIAVHLVFLAEACVTERWLAEEAITHVHAHFGTNATTVALLCRALGGPPYSFTVHGPEEFDRPELLKIREKVRHASFVVAISDYGRSQLLRWSDPEDGHKVHVVRCGIDRAFLDAPLTSVPSAPRFVCVSRLAQEKGLRELLEAVERLLEDGVDVEVLIAGDGPFRQEMARSIERSQDPQAVRLLGWQSNDEVRLAIEGARALILPSYAEGLPVVVMESLARGRPVITSQVAGIPELVDDQCGWLVPPGAVGPLVTAMRAALDAPTERLDEMGREGARRVEARHDIDRQAALLASLFATASDP